jgi:hypothetical protein
LFILSTGRKHSVGAFAAMDLREGQVIDILETLQDADDYSKGVTL